MTKKSPYGKYELTPKERVNILSKRLIALRLGKGHHPGSHCATAIRQAEGGLRLAFRDKQES